MTAPTEVFSFYNGGISQPVPSRDMMLPEFIGLVKSDTYKDLIIELRTLKTKEEKDAYKKGPGFDYATIVGTFSYRKIEKLMVMSGLSATDIDDLKDEADAKKHKERLKANPYILAMFISASGKGLKIIFRVPPDKDKYETYFVSFTKSLGFSSVNMDLGTKDLSRATFISYDPDAYYNEQALVWDIEAEPEMTWTELQGQKDMTRSGLEFRRCVELVKVGKSFAEICEIAKTEKVDWLVKGRQVTSWEKWNHDGKHYQEWTYQHAVDFAKKYPDKNQNPEPTQWIIEAGNVLFEKEFGEEKYIVDKIIPEDSVIFFAGRPGDFKSYFALYTACCISAGKPVLGLYHTEKSGVLFIDEENGLKRIGRRLKKVGKGMSLKAEDLANIQFCSYNDVKLNFKKFKDAEMNSATVEQMTKIIKEGNIKLVILDSMVRMMEGSENDSSDVRTCFQTLKEVMKNCPDICFLIIHHLTKVGTNRMEDMRGSGDFGAMAGVVCNFCANKNNVMVTMTKHRDLDKEQFPLMDFTVGDIEEEGIKVGITFSYMTREEKEIAHTELRQEIRKFLVAIGAKTFRNMDMEAEFVTKGGNSSKTLSAALYWGVNVGCWAFVNGKNGRSGYKVINLTETQTTFDQDPQPDEEDVE